MNSQFGEVFLFLTDLAWKSRMTIPMLVTTVFLVMDIRLQIEFNIQSGQVAAAELDQLEDSDDDDNSDDDNNHLDEEYTSEESNVEEDNDLFYCEIEHGPVVEDEEEDDEEYENTANRLRRSLGLS